MSAQLSLDVDNEDPSGPPEVDLVESVIQSCGGDARTAVRETISRATDVSVSCAAYRPSIKASTKSPSPPRFP